MKKHQVLWAFSSVFTVFFVYFLTTIPPNFLFFATNALIMFWSLLAMSRMPMRTFSLIKITYVFVFFFFGVVPLNDEMNSNLYWGGDPIPYDYKNYANILILVGMFSFYLGSVLGEKFEKFKLIPTRDLRRVNYISIGMICCVVVMIVLWFFSFEIRSLFVRSFASSDNLQLASHSQIYSLFFKYFIRPMPVVLAVFYYHYFSIKKQKIRGRGYYLRVSILLGLIFIAFVFVSPTSLPRFMTAVLYIPLVLLFTGVWDRPYQMQISIIAALLVIFPFLDKFRNFSPANFEFSYSLDFLNHGHFDAYQNFARLLEVDYISYGHQLLGVFLFFVPRAVWPNKPLGSGSTLSNLAELNFDNISMPYIAEGYINFGILGVILFMFFLGLILSNLDKNAWADIAVKKNSVLVCYYYFMFGFIVFVMRGDLMSSFSYIFAFTLSFYVIYSILRLSSSNKYYSRG